jgi:hypothetical protein
MEMKCARTQYMTHFPEVESDQALWRMFMPFYFILKPRKVSLHGFKNKIFDGDAAIFGSCDFISLFDEVRNHGAIEG